MKRRAQELALAGIVALSAGGAGSIQPLISNPTELEVMDARVYAGEEPEYLRFEVDYVNAGAPLVAHCTFGDGIIAGPRAWNVDSQEDDGTIRLFGNGHDPQATEVTFRCFVTNSVVSSDSGWVTVPTP